MLKHNNFLSSVFLLLAVLFVVSCSEDENPTPDDGDGDPTGGVKYIISSYPLASEGVADYLLTVDNLMEGTVSTVGNGKEQDGTYRYYVTNNNRFFSMLYGQGNPGAVTTYELDEEGELTELSDFQSETVQAFAAIGDDILMTKVPRSGDENALWYRINTQDIEIVDEGQINVVELANNGERAHFSWLTQVGDKVFAPYFSIKGCCDDVFGTQYPDSSWIAVFNYPDMSLNTVIKDDRTSFIGRYFTEGLSVDENGDVYAFSSAVATNNGEYTSTKPSAIVRINSGELAFDQDYFFDIEEATNGYYVTLQHYLGNGKMLVMLSDVEEKAAYTVGNRFAIADVYTQTITWVDGAPDPATITNVTRTNLVENGTAYVGITTQEGSYVYEFDASTATATQGIEVEGGQITAINKLTY
ncbi:DUF4374 domain-containing protein [Catalinimonas niigatensis]|uniref:DUF4374 domain-containing protein n=1 Tax=Catalinimonas niigatensis TaxID=1397264 RepID=UPI0026651854|nr:DUF4374 domain-containing protein [Catalinimonas niigatensis]WPP49740.1 DUF4374 domain-containing protein [Catalinimonas niigatensis]